MKYGVRPQVKDIKYNATANCIGIVIYHKYKRTDGTLLSWFIWTYSIPKSFFNWFKSVNTTSNFSAFTLRESLKRYTSILQLCRCIGLFFLNYGWEKWENKI